MSLMQRVNGFLSKMFEVATLARLEERLYMVHEGYILQQPAITVRLTNGSAQVYPDPMATPSYKFVGSGSQEALDEVKALEGKIAAIQKSGLDGTETDVRLDVA